RIPFPLWMKMNRVGGLFFVTSPKRLRDERLSAAAPAIDCVRKSLRLFIGFQSLKRLFLSNRIQVFHGHEKHDNSRTGGPCRQFSVEAWCLVSGFQEIVIRADWQHHQFTSPTALRYMNESE